MRRQRPRPGSRKALPRLLGVLLLAATGVALGPPAGMSRTAPLPAEAPLGEDPAAWLDLGRARLQAGEPLAALEAFDRSRELGQGGFLLGLQASVAAASLGRPEEALGWVQHALEEGMPPGLLSEHAALAPLRELLAEHARFRTLMAEDLRRLRPCAADPRFRGADFWVGDWEVYTGGTLAGSSRVEVALEGCALREAWTGASGLQGSSMTYFDPAGAVWRQEWVDSQGGSISYRGDLRAGALELRGEYRGLEGIAQSRMVLEPLDDGTVRQRIERSGDGGATWKPYFEGIYRPTSTTTSEQP